MTGGLILYESSLIDEPGWLQPPCIYTQTLSFNALSISFPGILYKGNGENVFISQQPPVINSIMGKYRIKACQLVWACTHIISAACWLHISFKGGLYFHCFLLHTFVVRSLRNSSWFHGHFFWIKSLKWFCLSRWNDCTALLHRASKLEHIHTQSLIFDKTSLSTLHFDLTALVLSSKLMA